METSALGVQRTVWFDGIDDVLCTEASPRPLPAERAAGEVQVAAVLDSGRRLMASGSGSLGDAEHPGSDGPPQGVSIRTGHPLPPAADSRANSGLPHNNCRRAPVNVTRPTSNASPGPGGTQGHGATVFPGDWAEPRPVLSVGAPQRRGWGVRSTICW